MCKTFTTDTPLRNTSGNRNEKTLAKVSDFVDGSEAARSDFRDLDVFPDFVSEEVEGAIMQEVDHGFRRSKYQYSHWDEVCTVSMHDKTKDRCTLLHVRLFVLLTSARTSVIWSKVD